MKKRTAWLDRCLKRVAEADPDAAGLEDMVVNVLDPSVGLPDQARGIEIIDVMVLAVEQVEDVEECPDTSPFAACAQIVPFRRTIRSNCVRS